ncbi:major facilitator superfamily domain-containing protein [Xylariales sp. PMI_506]|nr:major facilitator superfamily domain-containing protein [Xylariales sp. PMI_506]
MDVSDPANSPEGSVDGGQVSPLPVVDTEKPQDQAPASAQQYPEGGSRAWLVVLGCWCTSFASFGYVNSFGVYETYYKETFLSEYSASDIAWIGSIQAFGLFSATLISGPLTDRYGVRAVIWPCSFLLVVGMMLTSLCTELYQFVLCQGLLVTIASGGVFTPALSIVGQYFSRKRPLAMALASTGSPTGGILYPIIMNNLLPPNSSIGFPWAQRICAFLSFFLLVIACATVRSPANQQRRRGPWLLLGAFRKPVYLLQILAYFLMVLGLWTPYFYLAEYGISHGMSSNVATYLFAVINGGSLVGRVIGGAASMRYGQFNVTSAASVALGILFFCWLRIFSPAGIVVLAVLIGAVSGIIIALMVVTLAHTADHPSEIGTYLGMSTFIIGFGSLAGAPTTGHLLAIYGDYTQGIVFSATTVISGAIVLIFARYVYAPNKLLV